MKHIRRQKRFLLFIGKLGGGGAERVFIEYANGLVKTGAEVHLVCLEGGSYESSLTEKVALYKMNVRMRNAWLPLFRLARKIRPDVILSGLTGGNLVGSIVGRLANIPSVWSSVHNDIRLGDARQKASLGWAEPLAIKVACKLSSQVITVSDGVRDFLIEDVGVDSDFISVIYNPIYHEDLIKLANQPIAPELSYLIDYERPFLVAAGRLERQKGFDLLIEAYRRSGLKTKGVRVVILGEGSELRSLRKQIVQSELEEHIFLPGFVNNPYSVFSKSCGFILSSRWEGFGNVLVEAMACGVPVISFDCPSGPAEVIGKTAGCIIVPNGDIELLAKAMTSLATKKTEEVEHVALLSRAKMFSRDASAEKLLHVLQRNDT